MRFRLPARFLARIAAVVTAAALLPWGGLLAAMDATGDFCALHGLDCGCREMCRREAAHAGRSERQPAAPACHRKSGAETPQRQQSCAANRCESGDTVPIWNPDRPYLAEGRFLPLCATDSAPLRAVETVAAPKPVRAPRVPPPQV